MRKFLSVLLAVMMVVSTVSFAAPSVVTVTDSATNAVVENTTDVTTDAAELTAESDYGTLVYSVDFERDDFDVAAFTTAYAQVKSSKTTAYQNPAFDFGNMTCYTNAAGDGFSNAQLVTEGENTYITGNVAASYDGFFRMTKYNITWPDGIYTFSVDVKIPAGQVANWAAQCNDTKLELVAVAPFNTASGDWQTVVFQTKDVIRGSNFGSSDEKGFYGFFVTPNNSTAGTVSYDNWKVYYKADKAAVVVNANGRKNASNITISDLTPNSEVPVSTLLAQAKAQNSDIIGFSLTADGAMLANDATVSIGYYDMIYAVYGFDVTMLANGNSEMSNVAVSGVDTRNGITVSELLSKINNTTSKNLRGISKTNNGDLLSASEVIKSDSDVTLYMIWEADESEYGTLLWNIDFEREDAMGWYGHTREVENIYNDNGAFVSTIASEYHPAFENFNHRVRFVINEGEHFDQGIVADSTGNHYMTGTAYTQYPQIYSTNYGGMKADGIYTVVFDAMSSSAQSGIGIARPEGAVWLDTWTVAANKWDTAVVQYEVTGGAVMPVLTFNFNYSAKGHTISYDNVKLYFKPTGNLNVTVDANGKSGASNVTTSVNSQTGITAGELKALMSGCIGIAETKNGDILPDDAVIVPKFNTTVYAVWGFDLTVNAGQNTAMSAVTVSGIDTRRGITVGEIISKINNTTGRTLRGLSFEANGNALSTATVITASSKPLYMVWEIDESEFGTLLFNIDFEKDGITAPAKDTYVDVMSITDKYNPDLVVHNVLFSTKYAASTELVTENGNTYLAATANGTDYINFFINEYAESVTWRNGTYTMIADIMPIGGTAIGSATHVKDDASYSGVTFLDTFANVQGQWDCFAQTYTGVFSSTVHSSGDRRGHFYFAYKMPKDAKIAIDNLRVYFKTDETVVTVKPNGNSDISDIEVPVSTSTGITVAEIIAEVNKHETTKTLLGISYTPLGDVLPEETVIRPDYQMQVYAIWKSKGSNPMVHETLGKLIFSIDFEREEVISNNWDGYSPLGGGTWGNSEVISKTATLYDTTLFNDTVNSKVRFTTNDRSQAHFNASIKASADGENHWLEGTNGPEGSGTLWPQFAFFNYGNVVAGNGIYTVFIDVNGPAGSFKVHPDMSAYNPQMIDYTTYQNSTWNYVPNAWNHFAYKYEVTDGSKIPVSSAFFSLNSYNQTVAFDNYKLYYKPFTATITLNAGDYPEFGETKVENISTTGENTGADIVAAIQADLDVCGREFVGLMDEYGEMLDLDKALVIPGDVTYTIVWGDATSSIVTKRENSIRISTKETSRGLRFAATVGTDDANNESTTEYGWIMTRKSFLTDKGISTACFTKESPVTIVGGKNYTSSEPDVRKHFSEDDNNIMITAVLTGLKPKYYAEIIVARPYIVIDGKTYYGEPWERSIYDTAVALRDKEYPGLEGDSDYNGDSLKEYIDGIISYVESNS